MSTVLPTRTLKSVEPLETPPLVPQPPRAPGRRRGTPETETARLYGEHRQRILAFCNSRLGSRSEAEDAAQETFAYALRLLRRGVVPEAELPWLYKIAFNVCRWKRRTLWRRGRLETAGDIDRLEEAAPAADATAERLQGLGEALATMPANQQRAFVLRELRGLSYREIAEILSVSESAVATLLFRARASLASRLQHTGEKLSAALNGLSLVALLRRMVQGAKIDVGVAALALTAGTIAAAPHLHLGIPDPRAEPPAAHHVRPGPGAGLPPRAPRETVESGSDRAAPPLPHAAAAATGGARATRPADGDGQSVAQPPAAPPAAAPAPAAPAATATPAAAPPDVAPAHTATLPPVPPLPNTAGLAPPAVAVPPAVSQAVDAVASAVTSTVSVPTGDLPAAPDVPKAPVPPPVPPPPTPVVAVP